MSATSRPSKVRRFTAARALRYGAVALSVIASGVFVAPEVLVRVAKSRATECLAKARAPRGAALPDCSHLIDDFELSSDVSYTRHDATYRAEELYARIAMDRYIDAAVGAPDPERLHRASFGVARAQDVVENGSQRISFEDLGRIAGAPHLGKLSASLGDRTALLRQPERTGLWWVRVIVLEYALLEADLDLAGDIAERYADWGPHDADLRTAVGAVLCMTNPRRGLDLLERVPQDRADKRYANIQRNYGEVVALQDACAAKLGQDPPPLPPSAGAGEADAIETRLTSALRLSARKHRGATPDDPQADERELLVTRAIDRLQGEGAGGVSPTALFARAMLLASVLDGGGELDAGVAANLVSPRAPEGPLGPRALSLSFLLGEPPGLAPRATAGALEHAADFLQAVAPRAAAAEQGKQLREAAAMMRTHAAASRARSGAVEDAVRLADGAAREAGLGAREAALSVASAAYVAGDPALALARLRSASEAPSSDEPPALTVGFASVDALLRAATSDLDGAKRVAATLPALAEAAKGTQAAFEAQWVALALSEIEPSTTAPPSLAWLGSSDTLGRYLEVAEPAQARTFSAWRAALGASSEQRRAFRYELFEHRGDAPAFILPFLVASARLLDDDTSSLGVETWLDTASAIDGRRLRLRSYAWARAEAARIRGDEIHARVWSERLARLRELAEDAENAEMALFLRL